MSLTATKARLTKDFLSIAGVTRVYEHSPQLVPAQADLPCIILKWQKPSIVPRAITTGLFLYEYQFDVILLYSVSTLDTVTNLDERIEPFPKRLIDKLSADITGGGAWSYWNKDDGSASMTIDYISYNGGNYFGLRWNLVISEQVATTMEVGT